MSTGSKGTKIGFGEVKKKKAIYAWAIRKGDRKKENEEKNEERTMDASVQQRKVDSGGGRDA